MNRRLRNGRSMSLHGYARTATICCGLGLLWGFFSTPALGWGYYERNDGGIETKTHHKIDEGAHVFAMQDAAFQGTPFPDTAAAIVAHEGVYAKGKEGNGPDKEGVSGYSEHYYNPNTDKGGAPQAISKWYKRLAEDLTIGNPGTAPRAAAWGAHYLADMSCPYHVIGMPGAEAKAAYEAAKATGVLQLSVDVRGLPEIYGYQDTARQRNEIMKADEAGDMRPSGQYTIPNTNFLYEASNYVARLTGTNDTSHLDWFDPWYYNTGISAASDELSSHIYWEGNSWAAFTFNPWSAEYSQWWVKTGSPTKPSPDAPWTENVKRMELLAKKEADYTRSQVSTEINSIGAGYRRSVINVYTMWRAAVSGLSPGVEWKLSGRSPDGNEIYKVTPYAFNKLDSETFNATELRFTLLGGAKIKTAPSAVPLVSVGPSEKAEFAEWELEVLDPKNVILRLEVFGNISANVPDLQYACIETNLVPAEVENSIIFLIDGSGSMAGKKIEAAKSSASASIGRTSSAEVSEIAVFSFHGSGVNRVASFTVVTPAGKADLTSRIAGISDSGGTNLAEGIRLAGGYLRRYGRGKNFSLIILSDGEETCGGDPAAEIAALNGMRVSERHF